VSLSQSVVDRLTNDMLGGASTRCLTVTRGAPEKCEPRPHPPLARAEMARRALSSERSGPESARVARSLAVTRTEERSRRVAHGRGKPPGGQGRRRTEGEEGGGEAHDDERARGARAGAVVRGSPSLSLARREGTKQRSTRRAAGAGGPRARGGTPETSDANSSSRTASRPETAGKPGEARRADEPTIRRARGTYLRHVQPGGGGSERASGEKDRHLHVGF
jgi:hypothetical protein